MHNKFDEQITFLEKDFCTLASHLTENYHPHNLTAMANIGSVLNTMLKLKHKHHEFDKNEPIAVLNNMMPEHSETQNLHAEITDELNEAEKYHKQWLKTNEPGYKEMACDELRHADFFITKLKNSATTDDATALADFQGKFNRIYNKLHT